MKVLHCPHLVGGNPHQLAIAEKSLGLDSYVVTQYQNYLQYSADKVLSEHGRIMGEVSRWYWALYESAKFDVIHYNAGSSLLPMRTDASVSRGRIPCWARKIYNLLYANWFEFMDVRIASRRNQVIAVTYQGDDARQGGYCREHYPIHFVEEVEQGYYTDVSDAMKRERIHYFDQYADLIYALNPDLLNVLPKRAKFLPYANVDLHQWQPSKSRVTFSELHVIHAPSHREVKGTKYLLDAVNRLKAEGYHFRFTLVEGMSHREAMKLYQSADILVDQLLAGFYGGLSVELMALAKPVICYLRESDMRCLPADMVRDTPIINADPSSIYDVMKYWLSASREELVNKGLAGRRYVEHWHDPQKIAVQLKREYEWALQNKQKRLSASS